MIVNTDSFLDIRQNNAAIQITDRIITAMDQNNMAYVSAYRRLSIPVCTPTADNVIITNNDSG